LDFKFWASAASDQEALDAGVGLGGMWTSHFIAKGKLPNPSILGDHGKVIYGTNSDG
jgi:hypothetical protein